VLGHQIVAPRKHRHVWSATRSPKNEKASPATCANYGSTRGVLDGRRRRTIAWHACLATVSTAECDPKVDDVMANRIAAMEKKVGEYERRLTDSEQRLQDVEDRLLRTVARLEDALKAKSSPLAGNRPRRRWGLAP